MDILPQDPILTPSEATAFEEDYFGGNEDFQWEVINRAGEAVADSALRDMRELRTIPHRPRLLVLVGKGHNGADSLLAAKRFLRTIPTARAVVWQWAPKDDCKPMTKRAFEELIEFASKRLEIIPSARELNQEKMDQTFNELTKERGFDLAIDDVPDWKVHWIVGFVCSIKPIKLS